MVMTRPDEQSKVLLARVADVDEVQIVETINARERVFIHK